MTPPEIPSDIARRELEGRQPVSYMPTEYSEHARFVLHEIARRWGIPRYMLDGDQVSQSYAQAKAVERDSAWMLPRLSPAVKMANRSLPNPNGEPKL